MQFYRSVVLYVEQLYKLKRHASFFPKADIECFKPKFINQQAIASQLVKTVEEDKLHCKKKKKRLNSYCNFKVTTLRTSKKVCKRSRTVFVPRCTTLHDPHIGSMSTSNWRWCHCQLTSGLGGLGWTGGLFFCMWKALSDKLSCLMLLAALHCWSCCQAVRSGGSTFATRHSQCHQYEYHWLKNATLDDLSTVLPALQAK